MKNPPRRRTPFGLGATKPRHFREMARVAWDNRRELPFAWRILRDGVCDGCALGTSGLKDWTIPGTHLCMVRLELLKLNTMEAIDEGRLADVSDLSTWSSRRLRGLGRLAHPMIRRAGEPGFRRLSWAEAIDEIAASLGEVVARDPTRLAFYLTSRGIPNETYYVAQRTARLLGTPHVDNSARLCHAASTVAMKRAVGVGASTGSYKDWLESDLIVFFGSNVANNQPVTTKYLHYAKKRGAKVAVVNPYREPGMARYWVPSVASSAVFGTTLADRWFEVDTGGDLAFLNGTLKALLEIPGGVDQAFVEQRTSGFDQVAGELREASWDELEMDSGATREQMSDFAQLLVDRPNAIFVWSMGLTQHAHGVDTIQALCNVGLARGLVGRSGRGLTPIRGHSGVQGGAEVGCVPIGDDATLDRWREVWGFDPPRQLGLATVGQIDAAALGHLDAFWILGGNFLETVPDEARCRQALERPKLRVHQDILVNSSMMVAPSETVLLLPAATRYETPGGVTETTTERRIVYSPEIPGRRVGEARPEWEVLCEVAGRVRPELAERAGFADLEEVRREIAQAIPLYAGIENLQAKGDQFQWRGPTLFEDGPFDTADGRAHFVAVQPPLSVSRSPGEFFVSTRRGKQFNSMVQASVDPLTGLGRDEVLMSEQDRAELGFEVGEHVRLRSRVGEMLARVQTGPIKPGNLEVHWPEGMQLLPDALDPESLEPEYATVVRMTRLVDAALEEV